jgi:non-specific serine/threonine protein kinase
LSAPYHNKALPEGTILREWRLEEVLGVGGFGIVYRGKDVYFGETVAIKEYFPGAISDRIDGATVTPTDSSSEEIYTLGRQKFLEEAKILWNLSHPERHPNIVSVRSLFEIHGTAYMVMDFENGISLSQMLREGKKFDEQGLMALIRPIAEGLDRAHKAGVLHRDIKPANILVAPDGRPVLIDFGSARFESNQATNTKVTFYTPPYAAIEQYVKSYPQGAWTDIYALGVVMYQCITGEKPPEVLERMHAEEGQPLSAREWPGFSKTFTRAVDAAMAIRPLERPASITSWLKQFDVKDAVAEDAPTRFGTVMAEAPPPPAPVAVAPVVAPPEPPQPAPLAPVEAAPSEPAIPPTPIPAAAAKPADPSPVYAHPGAFSGVAQPKPRSGKTAIILLGSAAVFAVLALAGFFVGHWHKTPDTAPVASAPISAQLVNNGASLDSKMDALIEAAKKAGRGSTEIADLGNAKIKIEGFAKDGGLALTSAVQDMARAETESLGRAEKRLWRDVDSESKAVTGDAPAKLQQAKSALDAALDAALAVPAAADAGKIIDDTRVAVASFGAFQEAYATAAPLFIAAKQKDFETLHAAVTAASEKVVVLAAVDKPWILASRARKDAYKLRQDNAAQAKTLSGQVDTLSKTVATAKDLRQVNAALTQAAAAQKSLTSLQAASSAAPVE